MDLKQLHGIYGKGEAKKSIIDQEIKDIEKKIEDLNLSDTEQASIVLQKLSEIRREEAKKKLENICTYALQYAISADYSMEIEMGKFRNVPSAELFIKKEGSELRSSPLDENGGGIVDILSMALRYIVMQVHKPFIDGPIIMDEPYKMLSVEFIPMVAEFIKKLSDDFGRQIIFCTHNEYLANICSKKIYVSNENMESKVREG